MATAGASQASWMLLAFPWLQKRLGTGTLLRISSIGWPTLLVCYPIMNELVRHGLSAAGLWGVSIPVIVLGSGVSMTFGKRSICAS
jgi:hypothetical protein